MNGKSLLLGSAVALSAVSSAYAADVAPVAEPEPADYVKICDAYGVGYYYIPGTETCLRVGGSVRFPASAGDGGLSKTGRVVTDADGERSETWKTLSRFALDVYTAQETELGTLKTFTETYFDFPNGGPSTTTLYYAWMQLGGLRIGKDRAVYDQFLGNAGKVINDDIIPFGIKETNLISYYFGGSKGFSGAISLEQGSGAYTIDSYVPHITGGLKYAGDWGSIAAVLGYDSNWEEWAGKARLDLTPSKALSLFVMLGYGTDDNVAGNFYKPWNGNFAVWGGGTYRLTEKAALNTQVAYTDFKDFAVSANIAYEVVPGFVITPEIDYYDNFDDRFDESFGGMVRFQRNF